MIKKHTNSELPGGDPLWYKDAVIYELHVRAFHDSNGDGVGDFRGLTQKLDYLAQLGVTALWILPFYPSPLRDDGYDIADYQSIHPPYGTMRDFKEFLRAAHDRGLRVITELIINHTSDQHPWFQRARRAKPGSRHRDFYVWSDTTDRYADARIIFKDFERSNWTYDPVAGAYYWHRFYAHQPDLNFDNPAVRRAVNKVMDFWFELGVDGMRLDAIPYLFEREGTDCENLPETHVYLKELRRHLDRTFPGRMLLAEANQWPEDAAAYFGDGDECHMNFHFPLMPRLFMALYMEDRHPIIDILEQTPAIPESSQWALFLRNHDELTLEMVTDEERDYMYRVYGAERRSRINLGIRRRLAPLLNNNRRRIELMYALLLSLPGTPVLYYGDELGMGDNIHLGDRNGVRTPMQWSSDRNAGFSRANPQSLYLPVIIDPEFHCDAVNVEAQLQNSQSLLWWTRRVIALRKRYPAFGRGDIAFLSPENRKILAFVREHGDERLLVVANLSRYVQATYIDLSEHRELVPVELFGQSELPRIGAAPYFLTLGPHAFYWFSLERREAVSAIADRDIPALSTTEPWWELLDAPGHKALRKALPDFLRAQRWFGGKAKEVDNVAVGEVLDVPRAEPPAKILMLHVGYADAEPETYLLPVGFATGPRSDELLAGAHAAVLTRLTCGAGDEQVSGVLFDVTALEPAFASSLLDAIRYRRHLKGSAGRATGARTRALGANGEEEWPPPMRAIRAEQSNTSAVFGDRFILKLFRRLEAGAQPDLEVPQFLTRQRFAHAPAVAGHLAYHSEGAEPTVLGVVHSFVANDGDAWQLARDRVELFLDRAMAAGGDPKVLEEALGPFLESTRLLGQRTAELHLALGADDQDPAFAPEPFTPFYRRSLFESLRKLSQQVAALLDKGKGQIPERDRALAAGVRKAIPELREWLQTGLARRLRAVRTRTHGDLHLGQVLYTGKDFVFIDFEGEPARSLEQRRLKQCPLRDVAGMVRSFHYAALSGLRERVGRRVPTGAEQEERRRWVEHWFEHITEAYVESYLERCRDAPLYANLTAADIELLLRVFLVEKSLYEVRYELNNRPAWSWIPLEGVARLARDLDLAP